MGTNHLRERRYAAIFRSLTLPTRVKGDAIEARYDAGVLTLRLPMVEEATPKKISIQMPIVIEAHSKK